MGERRSMTVVLVCAVVLAACIGGGSGDADDGGSARVERAEVDFTGVFDEVGIAVVDMPTDGVTSVGPMQLWQWQVDNIEREFRTGGGFLGVELDALIGNPVGGVPMSYVVAAWLAAAPTASAALARDLMGSIDGSDAPAIVFPVGILAMFVADVVDLSDELGWNAAGPQALRAAAQPTGSPAGAAGSVCSTLSGWVNTVLTGLFDALTIEVDDDSDFGWLADVWNTAVSFASDVVSGLIDVLTAPIVTAIADGVAIIGTLAMMASLLQPWTLEVGRTAATVPFAVGDEPNVDAAFVAQADTNVPDVWPEVLVDCASVAGFELPDLSSAAGAAVGWTVVGFPELGTEQGREAVLGDGGTARLRFVTGREEHEQGDEVAGHVAAAATVTSSTPDQLQALLAQLIADQIPIPPFDAIVTSLFHALTEPVFAALASMVQVHGAATIEVVRHEIDESRLYDGTWAGIVFSFATSTPETLAAGSTSEGSEARILVPIEVVIDDGAVTGAEARYVQHSNSFITGRTVAGADGSGYGLMTATADRLSVSGEPDELVVSGPYEERWETFIRSDFDIPANRFTVPAEYADTIPAISVTCASAGRFTTGSASGGNFFAGYWLALDTDGRASDIVDAGVRLSGEVHDATDLPARPGDRGGLEAAIARFDDVVRRFIDAVPDGCGIGPVVDFANALRGRAVAT